eukprot:m.285927 g.285927  ORF g.285927 m.285927 type:complete len:289 (+) comp54978_c0_seq15:1501-2367(+)
MMPHALPKCVQSSPKPRPHGSARRLHVPPRHAEFSPDHVRVVPVDWYMIPPSASPVLQTQAELDALGTYVAPIVYGGLGNNMYQIAALSVHARKLGIPCVIGFFKHWNREFHSFDMFGGHPAPAPFITLKNVFPNILFANFEPAVELQHTEINNKYAFEISEPDEFVPLPSLEELQERRFVHGYFFNSAYWHPERQHVLDLFDAHPAVKAYVQAYYGEFRSSSRPHRLCFICVPGTLPQVHIWRARGKQCHSIFDLATPVKLTLFFWECGCFPLLRGIRTSLSESSTF